MRRYLICLALGAVTSGCTSYQSQLITETEYGEYKTTPVTGIPVVITVPQKLGFLVTETTYEVTIGTRNDDGSVGEPQVSYITETSIDRNPIALGDSKLVSLDIKRPFYGTAESSFELANQYPTKINSKVDDKTLDRVLESVDKIIEKQGEESGAGAATQKRAVKQVQYLLVYDPVTRTMNRAGLG